MKQDYRDAMAIGAKFGEPVFFLTLTCNPKWPKIANSIPKHLTPSDHRDTMAKCFNLKKCELIEDIQKLQVLGVMPVTIYVIEMIRLFNSKTLKDMNATICVEIPDAETPPGCTKM